MNDNETNNINNFTNSDNSNVPTYKATGNLNTMISNPSINVNDPMNINIQNNTSFDTQVSNQNLNTDTYVNSVNTNTINANNNNNNINDNLGQENNNQPITPVVNENQNINQNTTYVANQTITPKKKKTIKISFSKETKIALLIAFILLIFILIMPGIYDFFRGL